MAMQIRFSNCNFLMKFSFTNSLIIGSLSCDGRSCEYIVIWRVNGLPSCSSGCMLPLPFNEDQNNGTVESENCISQHDMIFSLQKLMICNLMDACMKSHVLYWGIITRPKLKEALAIDSGKEGRLTVEVDFEQKECDEAAKVLDCSDNGCVMKMMTNMGYRTGIGLGRRNEGPPTFIIDFRTQKSTFGLGYRPTTLDDIIHTRIVRERARAKAENIPFEVRMSPYPLTLNGQFVRAGEMKPYWGFQEAVIKASGWEE